MSLDFLVWIYVKDIVYKTPVTSLDQVKLRIFAATESLALSVLQGQSSGPRGTREECYATNLVAQTP
jgi:hypothetical protein